MTQAPETQILKAKEPQKQAATNASFYRCAVSHVRTAPKEHKLKYSVWTLLCDVDSLSAGKSPAALLGFGRFGLLSVRAEDFGRRAGLPLGEDIRHLLAQHGQETAPRSLKLLTFPKMLGYSFRPLSLYYAYDHEDRLCALVYEVNNTFGERHHYVFANLTNPGALHQAEKDFYVSPFMKSVGQYEFKAPEPAERLYLTIRSTDPAGNSLSAAMTGDRFPVTNRRALHIFLSSPFQSFKIMAGIHLEAFKLWRKKIPFFRHVSDPNIRTSAGTRKDPV